VDEGVPIILNIVIPIGVNTLNQSSV